MELCDKKAKAGCNGFEYNGKTYVIYKISKTVKPKIGHVAYIYSGVKVESNSYLWAKVSKARITGYDNDTQYKSLSAATKACAASATCKVG